MRGKSGPVDARALSAHCATWTHPRPIPRPKPCANIGASCWQSIRALSRQTISRLMAAKSSDWKAKSVSYLCDPRGQPTGTSSATARHATYRDVTALRASEQSTATGTPPPGRYCWQRGSYVVPAPTEEKQSRRRSSSTRLFYLSFYGGRDRD